MPVPIMNDETLAVAFCDMVKADGILFTGGNDLSAYGGNAPERDGTEEELLRYAMERDIPLLGICRGMQMIAYHFGSKLEKVDGHVRQEHKVYGRMGRERVNSYHGMGILEVKAPIEVLAQTEDGVIEAIRHTGYRIAGIMWHPERVKGFSKEDIEMVTRFYDKGELR